MSMKITRRKLTAVLVSAAGIAAARAQETSASQPEDVNSAAKAQLRKDAEAMAKVDLPMTTEPAFHFKA